jgi:hypothetical protein
MTNFDIEIIENDVFNIDISENVILDINIEVVNDVFDVNIIENETFDIDIEVVNDIFNIDISTFEGTSLLAGLGDVDLSNLQDEQYLRYNESSEKWENITVTTDIITEGDNNLYDKEVVLTAGANVTITGTYPNFTISSSGGITTVTWNDILDKPSTFPPSSHTHPISQVVNLQDALDSKYDVSNPAGYITGIEWDEITGDQSNINLSGFTNDLNFLEADDDVTITGDWAFNENIVLNAMPTDANHVATIGWVTANVSFNTVWRDPVVDFVDFTTAEPTMELAPGIRYIATVTGTSNVTATEVIKNYIYERNLANNGWNEIEPLNAFTLKVEVLGAWFTYNADDDMWVSLGTGIAHNSLFGIMGSLEGYHLSENQYNNVFYRNVHTSNDITESGKLFFTNTRVDDRVKSANYNGLNSIAGNWTFTNNITVPATPVNSTHAASKQYVDLAVLLSQLYQLPVISRTTDAGDITPVSGARYIVPIGATGDFVGEDNNIAVRNEANDGWDFSEPLTGWTLIVTDESKLYNWNGTAWIDITASSVWGGIGGTLSAQTDLWNELLARPYYIYNNELAIVETAATDGTIGISTDTNKMLIRLGGIWYSAPIQYTVRPDAVDMGFEQENETSGYYHDAVADKLLAKIRIARNGVEQHGGLRTTADGFLQLYRNNEWKTLLDGVNIVQENGRLLFFADGEQYGVYIHTGDSKEKDFYNQRPMVQDYKTSMGIHQYDLIIHGGTF